jgi:peptidoglycan/xylan/chitin deacetylase (PgdA/CDA1 family)
MPISPTDTSQYKGQAMITLVYDDGYKSNFENALPLHLEFNIQAGFAIIATRALNKRYPGYMKPWQVAEAAKQGIEICSHSYTHPHLPEVNDQRLDFELRKSQDALQNITGKPVTAFCVPFSTDDARVIGAAEKYYSTVRVKGKKFTPVVPKGDDRVVYSFGLTKDSTFEEVKKIIDKAVAEKAWVTLMLHGVVWQRCPEQREYEIDKGLLRQILTYIKDAGPVNLLPINLSDIHKIREAQGIPESPKPAPEAPSFLKKTGDWLILKSIP